METTEPVRRPRAAMMFHLLDWGSDSESYDVAPGLRLGRMAGSAVETLYHRLCEVDCIDDAEPYLYLCYADFSPSEKRQNFLYAGDPLSGVDRLCNVVSIAVGAPLSMTRIIWSHDGFATAVSTEQIHAGSPEHECLQPHGQIVTNDTFELIARMWSNIEPPAANSSPNRVGIAVTYFGYAWRAWYLDQVCLNLAIALELLFAPHSQSETTHQLAFNVSHFLGGDRRALEDTFELVRRFYKLRSSIVHGGAADVGALGDTVPQVFTLVAVILRRILNSKELTRQFASDAERRQLIRDLVFWEQKFAP